MRVKEQISKNGCLSKERKREKLIKKRKKNLIQRSIRRKWMI